MRPTLADILEASARLDGVIVRTPLLRCDALDELADARVYVKAECLQRGGAFKLRGAFNRMATLSADELKRGILAYSSGNHAIGVAIAARLLGTSAIIVMPADAPAVKREAVLAQGAQIITFDRTGESREDIAARLLNENGRVLVKPFDDPQIIAGQGVAGLEIGAEIAPDIVLVPASGGGLASGVALALPQAKIFAVEPEGHDDIARSLAAGQIVQNEPGVRSICDALMAPCMGDITFAIGQKHFAGALSVDDAATLRAMRFALQHLKIVLEPGGAIALAALLEKRVDVRDKVVAVIASGANVDAAMLKRALE